MTWQQTVGLVLCFIVLCAAGCGDPEPAAERELTTSVTPRETDGRPPFEGTIVIGGADQSMDPWESDPYELGSGEDAPFIENDVLTLTLSYSGGCARHDFTIFTSSHFLESYPVQLNAHLVHDAHDDPCEAYPTEQYEFDLSPIRMLYQAAYRMDEGVVLLSLQGPAPSRSFPNQGFAYPVYYGLE